jgi:hypothetical protein
MHEWIHICSDVDSGQDMEKPTITFFVVQEQNFCYLF